jgi:hypothetical protein
MNKKIQWLIGKAIREAKYLEIKYLNKKDETKYFWICIYDVTGTGKIKVKGFNVAKEGHIETELEISKIQSAEILRFSTYEVPEGLVEKLENDESLSEFEFSRYKHSLLNYYLECYKANHDPFLHRAHLIDGVDLSIFKSNTEYELKAAQFNKIIQDIYHKDYNRYYEYDLAISEFAIDVRSKGKYVVAFRKLRFDPIQRKLIVDSKTTFNPHFYLSDEKHTLSYYSEMNFSEFEELYHMNREELLETLRKSFTAGEQINTRPEMVVLGYRQIDISEVYDTIHAELIHKQLEVPMAALFERMTLQNRQRRTEPHIVLVDRKANIDQINTVYNALKYPITYVQGPPGTGKTQTILNIIVNCLINRRTVLVSSNNNTPIDGILEKLELGTYKGKKIQFPMLRLGNKDYVASALQVLKERFQVDTKDIPKENLLNVLKEKSKERNKEFLQKLQNHDERLKLKQDLEFVDKLLTQKSNYLLVAERERISKELSSLGELSDSDLIGMYEVIKDNESMLQFFYFESLKYLKNLQKGDFDELKEILALDEIEDQVREFNKWIGIDANMKKLSEAFPIILTTNLSSRKLGNKFKFNLLIMDEAGQCDVSASLIPISKCKNMVLIGDTNQLKPVVIFEEEKNEKLMEYFGINPEHDYYNNSILSLYKRNDNISTNILLAYHYRCGKKIINYSNMRYYERKLNLTKLKREGSLKLLKVRNNNVATKNSSIEEAKEIVDYIKREKLTDVFIITPFRNQDVLLKEVLEEAIKTGEVSKSVACGTVHKIQGHENKTIILSTSISKETTQASYNWIKDNHELLNVAITRAQDNLIVVADTEAIKKLSNRQDDLYALVKYVYENGETEVQQSVTAKFTIGYSNNSLNEDEFYRTLSHYCTVNGAHYQRNVKILSVFPEELNNAEVSKKEFDGVLYEGRKAKVIFELNGNEHYTNKKRLASDKIKMELAKRKGILLMIIPNHMVKHYESITAILNKVRGDAYQRELFEGR